MTDAELEKTIEILGGPDIVGHTAAGAGKRGTSRTRSRKIKNLFEAPDDRTKWTQLIRAGIPSKALESAAGRARWVRDCVCGLRKAQT
jgi:hypothetical protein